MLTFDVFDDKAITIYIVMALPAGRGRTVFDAFYDKAITVYIVMATRP